jgi:serine/threonine protein kinase
VVDSQHDPLADPLIGQTLDGRLKVLRRIGEGGMGTVYVAEHVGLGKQVAVKVLNEQYAGQDEIVARLHSEARHAAAIHNEHIVDVFDIGTTPGGRPFVVMELLHGESLAERLRLCRVLSEADTLRIGRQLASALAAAHKSGIVHRDIKPENIFLSPRDGGDFVKVLDFGISKALASPRGDDEAGPQLPSTDPRLTRTGAVMGTPLYMAPEQVRGEPLDHRVDIYALGIVLYECLTGSVPFLAPSYLAVIAKILTESPEPPSLRSPERSLPAAVEQIVLRAMAHDRDLRYPTMDLLLEDLDRYGTGRDLQDATWQQPSGELDAMQRMPINGKHSRPKVDDRPVSGARLGVGSGSALPVSAILIASAVVLGAGLMLTLWRAPQPSPVAAQAAPQTSAPPARTAQPAASPTPQVVAPPETAAASAVAVDLGADVAASPTSEETGVAVRRTRPQGPAAPEKFAEKLGEKLGEKPGEKAKKSSVRPADSTPPQPLLEEQAPNPFLPPPSR